MQLCRLYPYRLISIGDLSDGCDIGSGAVIAEFELLFDEVADACPGASHDIFESRAHKIDLGATFEELIAHVGWEVLAGH